MAARRCVAERPWRQSPGPCSASVGSPSHAAFGLGPRLDIGTEPSFREPQAFVVEVPPLRETLYESSTGDFVAEGLPGGADAAVGGAQVQATRHCCVFSPEPPAAGVACAAPPAFRPVRQAVDKAVRPVVVASSPLLQGAAGLLDGWLVGKAGSWLEKLWELRDLAGWILLEHWVVCALLYVISLLREVLRLRVPAMGGPTAVACGPAQVIAWHPHRDVLATLSARGAVAVHSMGDTFSGGATQYLRADDGLGVALCLAWQPNDLRGALAVGMSGGIALWRHAESEGWWCAWSMRGEPFACPAVAWSPDGRCLATAGAHGIVRVWPHNGLLAGQSAPWCVTLRRWCSGPVASLQWRPDGALLAVAHTGAEPFVRLWSTRSWEVALNVVVGGGGVDDATTRGSSLAWCGGETLFGAAAGRLFEIACPSGGGRGWATGFSEPSCRPLAIPRLVRGGGLDCCDEGGVQQVVLEVAVCPRTAQRVAVRVKGASHILVFERLGSEGWARQELVLRGFVSAGGDTARPCSLAFAGNPARRCQLDAFFEGSLLAVYWDFGEDRTEVRTYPMHYLPYKLMQNDASVLFD